MSCRKNCNFSCVLCLCLTCIRNGMLITIMMNECCIGKIFQLHIYIFLIFFLVPILLGQSAMFSVLTIYHLELCPGLAVQDMWLQVGLCCIEFSSI